MRVLRAGVVALCSFCALYGQTAMACEDEYAPYIPSQEEVLLDIVSFDHEVLTFAKETCEMDISTTTQACSAYHQMIIDHTIMIQQLHDLLVKQAIDLETP